MESVVYTFYYSTNKNGNKCSLREDVPILIVNLGFNPLAILWGGVSTRIRTVSVYNSAEPLYTSNFFQFVSDKWTLHY